MFIDGKRLKHWIDNFYGYGSWQAPVWFVAYEEGGGDTPEEVASKINYFSEVHSDASEPLLCDIRKLYSNVAFHEDGRKADLYANLYEYRFGKDATHNNIWKNLTTFQHAYLGENIPDLLDYQKHAFASSAVQKEALIRLYPLPSPHNHAWYYSWLDMPDIPYLKSRVLYEQHVYERRIHSILQKIAEYKPSLVLMYGMSNINLLKQSVNAFFSTAKFRMVKAVKQKIPQHHRADFDGITLLITTQIPALRHNRIETGFDWQAFGEMVKKSP